MDPGELSPWQNRGNCSLLNCIKYSHKCKIIAAAEKCQLPVCGWFQSELRLFWPILYFIVCIIYSIHNIVYIIYSVHNTVYIIYSAHNDGNVLDKTLLVVRFGFGLAASRVLVSQTCCGVFPRLSFLIFGHSCFKCIGSLWELKLPLCVHWKWCQHLLWSGRGKHCHHIMMFKTAKDYFEMSKCECFSQEILFVLFLLINTNQTFNTNCWNKHW